MKTYVHPNDVLPPYVDPTEVLPPERASASPEPQPNVEKKGDLLDALSSYLYNMMRKKQEESRDIVGGSLRGASSIGSVLIDPFDSQARKERLAGVEGGLRELGFQTEGPGYEVGRTGTEVAGTYGTGGALFKAASKIPTVAKNVPHLLDAIRTWGMSAGGAKGIPGAMTRAAGGGVTAGTATALIDPEQAPTGAVIGASTPLAVQAAGRVGHSIGDFFKGPRPDQTTIDVARRAQQAGFVIPPTQVKPSLTNRLLESLSGKITMQQNASAANVGAINRSVNKALGLPEDTRLSVEVLDQIRSVAGADYQAVRNAGLVQATKKYNDVLDDILKPYLNAANGFPKDAPHPIIKRVEGLRTDSFDASAAVDKIIQLREEASMIFRQGDKRYGSAVKRAADALEQAIDDHLVSIGAPSDMLQKFRDARKLIAKTYSVEAALNPASGNVSAAKLGAQIRKGKPLTGELKDVGDFALTFEKAVQPVEKMGSLPQLSPLDWFAGMYGVGNWAVNERDPAALWPAALMFMRPAARAAGLSGPVQRSLVSQPAGPLGLLGPMSDLLVRSAPAIAASR